MLTNRIKKNIRIEEMVLFCTERHERYGWGYKPRPAQGYHGYNALVPWMWAGFIMMFIGAIILIIPKLRNNYTLLPFACILIFIGAWIDKGLGMISGGFVPSPLHHVTEYAPTGPEMLITLQFMLQDF